MPQAPMSLDPSSPLLQPVFSNGRTYATSYAVHHQFTAQSANRGKYAIYGNFLRRMRAMSTYDRLVETADIIEMDWHPALRNAHTEPLQYLFESTPARHFFLLTARAQQALVESLCTAVPAGQVKRLMTIAKSNATARVEFPDAMTRREAAALLRVSVTTLHQLFARLRVRPCYRGAYMSLYLRADVERALALLQRDRAVKQDSKTVRIHARAGKYTCPHCGKGLLPTDSSPSGPRVDTVAFVQLPLPMDTCEKEVR